MPNYTSAIVGIGKDLHYQSGNGALGSEHVASLRAFRIKLALGSVSFCLLGYHFELLPVEHFTIGHFSWHPKYLPTCKESDFSRNCNHDTKKKSFFFAYLQELQISVALKAEGRCSEAVKWNVTHSRFSTLLNVLKTWSVTKIHSLMELSSVMFCPSEDFSFNEKEK